MKKMLFAVALFAAFSLVFWGTSSFAQEEQGTAAYTEGAPYHVTGWNTFEASWLIGHQVWSNMGDLLGQISDCVIDQTNGRVALVVLSEVPGLAREAAVPYSSLVRTDQGVFHISLPSAESASRFEGEAESAYRSAMSPGIIPAVIDPTWVASVYQHYEKTPYWTDGGQASSMVFYRESRLIGAPVQTPQGEMAGRIDDLTIAPEDGRIVFLLLEDVPGRPDSQIAVPFNELSMQGEKIYALDISRDKLATAPSFDEEKDLTNRASAETVYHFFGIRPYWSEEAGQ